jgi:hypothetical protein
VDTSTAIYYTLSTIAQTLAGARAGRHGGRRRLQGVEDIIGAGDAFLHTWEGGVPHAETWPLLLKRGPSALRERLRSHGDPLGQVENWQMCAGAYKVWHFRAVPRPRLHGRGHRDLFRRAARHIADRDLGLSHARGPWLARVVGRPGGRERSQ